MEAKDKKQLRDLTALRFSNLESDLKKMVEVKQGFKTNLAKLDAKTYAPEHLEKERTRLKAEYDVARRTANEEFTVKLSALETGIEELNSNLDLSDPKLLVALRLIEVSDGKLELDTVKQINASFANDQQALRALRDVYRAKGLAFGEGELEGKIYNIGETFDTLLAMVSPGSDVSITALSGAIGKVAEFEGVAFDNSPDPDALSEAMRVGAGLTP